MSVSRSKMSLESVGLLVSRGSFRSFSSLRFPRFPFLDFFRRGLVFIRFLFLLLLKLHKIDALESIYRRTLQHELCDRELS
jgi:hypothetical protein